MITDATGRPADVTWHVRDGAIHLRVAEKNACGRIHRHAGIALTAADLDALRAALEGETND